MSSQLSLFEPKDSALKAYRVALEKLDPHLATEQREALKSTWPDCPLEWEEELHDLLPNLVAEPLTLEPAIVRWSEFAALPLREKLGDSRLRRLQHRFFRLLLDQNRLPGRHLRTREGRSVGWLCWKAGMSEEAKKLLVREIRKFGDDPQTRVWLANCHFELGDPLAARINYREALLNGALEVDPNEIADRGGLEIDVNEIADPDLAKFLQSARRELGEWSPIEACIEGVLPAPRMSSRDQLDQYLNRLAASASPAATDRPTLNFYRCLLISVNRHLVDSATLLESRVTMKSLHPRLHARHLQLLERE